MIELIELIKDLKRIKPVKGREWVLVRKILTEQKHLKELIEEKKEVIESINKINYEFASKRISKIEVSKRWDGWMIYCGKNGLNMFTGGKNK